jgi:hypothetical protein
MINPAELWGPESARLLKLNSSPLPTPVTRLKGLSLCAASACKGLIRIACRVNAAVYRFVAPLATDIACVPALCKGRLSRIGRPSRLIEASQTGRRARATICGTIRRKDATSPVVSMPISTDPDGCVVILLPTP